MARIVVLDGYTLNPGDNSWAPLERFGNLDVHERTQPEEIVERAHDADIVVINKCPIDAGTIAALPKLKLIAVTATGYDIVDVAAARQNGVAVANVPVYGTAAVAQFTWALILELCHQVGRHANSVAAGDWTKSPDFCYWLSPQMELAGKRLGIVGYGRIGHQVASIGRAFGMSILASRRAGSRMHGDASVEWLSTEQLFSEADVVSLHCPLTPETEKMVNARVLSMMRRDAFLVNTARGGLIDEHALADALRGGRLAGAALDVVSLEPIRPENSLLNAPNCLITPHIAWTSLAARQRLVQATAENIAAFLAGKPQNIVI